jgi:amidohydrolase
MIVTILLIYSSGGIVLIDTAFYESLISKVIAWRRHLHRYPELSYHEKTTSQFVKDHLEPLGWHLRTGIGGHGVIADLEGHAPGKRICLRADMDALPIQDLKQVEYASQIPGVMHACGHDGHTAVLMGVAELLTHSKEYWSGSVRLIFQPAEEVPPGGAMAMIQEGALEGVDEIYGIHLWSPFPAGLVCTTPGPMMAAADEFTATIRGRGGHGGLPHESVDSVVVGAHAVVNLQSVVSRNFNPIEPGVISIGSFHAGTTFNVIAADCKLQGTVRTMSSQIRSLAKQRIEEVLSSTCAMFEAQYELDYILSYPPLINDPLRTEHVLHVARSLFGESQVEVCSPVMAAEDFAYYLERVPGCFIFVGASLHPGSTPHHHPMFDIDESALETSVRLLFKLAARI